MEQYTEIEYYLDFIPEGIKRGLIGQRVCDAIVMYNLKNENIEVNYSEVLSKKIGNNIFFNKDVCKNIVLFLPNKLIKTLMQQLNLSVTNIEDARSQIIKRKFGYSNADYSLTLLSALNLNPDKHFSQKEIVAPLIDEPIIPHYQLHQYQKNVKDKVIQELLNPSYSDRMLVHMPTGSGKTKTCMEVISDYIRCKSILGGFDKSQFIIWFAHSKELCEQAKTTFASTWKLRGDSTIDIYSIFGDAVISPEILNSEKAILFVGFQKFYSLLNRTDTFSRKIVAKIIDYVKLVIVDEAHKSIATTYQQSIQKLIGNALGVQLVGLTATPGRTNNESAIENIYLAEFFKSKKISLVDDEGIDIKNPISYLQNLQVLAKIEREEVFTDFEIKLQHEQIKELKMFGDAKIDSILKDLSVDPGRNQLIIEKIQSLVIEDLKVLVFACSVGHCLILQTLLNQLDIKSELVLGQTPTKERDLSIQKFKSGDLNVLINYGVLTTGFDAPTLNALVITRPTTSIVLYSQMVGRALRGPANGGNPVNYIIDLKDNFLLGTESEMFNFHNDFWNN